MFIEDYKKAFEILADTISISSLCLEKVVHSNGGKYIIFMTTCPGLRYFVELDTERVERRALVDTNDWRDNIVVLR